MKLRKGKKINEDKNSNTRHLKTASQDFNNSTNLGHPNNIYVSKLINQNQIKNKSLINESLPNLKRNIQNIFSNEDEKERVFRYLIQKNKKQSANTSKDLKKDLHTPVIKPYKKIEMHTKAIISPYNNKYFYNLNPNLNDATKSTMDIRPEYTRKKNLPFYTGQRHSGVYKNFISTNEAMYPNENNFAQNNNKTFSNLLSSNNSLNKNRGNKYEHISIYNTYNNTFNNYRMQKYKDNKIFNNQTYDYYNQNNFRNFLNPNEKNYVKNNQYKDYMKNSNLTKIKKKLLDNQKDILIDISDNENKNKTNLDFNNNYLNTEKSERIRVQKNENLNKKKNSIKSNDSNIIYSRNNHINYYVHKNLGYKKLDSKKLTRENSLSDFKGKTSQNESNNKIYQKRKNYYQLYGHKDIQIKTSENDKKDENDGQEIISVNTIKVNIDKKILKNYCNSPLSHRYNNYFEDQSKRKDSKKIYEKRETFYRTSVPSTTNSKKENYKTSNSYKDSMNEGNPINNNDLNKYVFNDEKEIIEFIKKKYNKRNINEILEKKDDADKEKNEREKEYRKIKANEEVNKIKKKNEELSSEIKLLKYENKQYKKELNDMKNKFNDISKEINSIKEKNK